MIDCAHIALVVSAWLMLLFGLRAAGTGFAKLAPIGHAGWLVLWSRPNTSEKSRHQFTRAVDKLNFRLSIATMTPSASILLFAGITLLGSGVVSGVAGNVARFASHNPDRWLPLDNAGDIAAGPLLCTGIACILASVTSNRRVSLMMAIGWTLAATGIGIVTTAWAPHG